MDVFSVFRFIFLFTTIGLLIISLKYNRYVVEAYGNMLHKEYYKKTLKCFTPMILAFLTGVAVILVGLDVWGMRNFEIIFSFLIIGYEISVALALKFVYLPLAFTEKAKADVIQTQ